MKLKIAMLNHLPARLALQFARVVNSVAMVLAGAMVGSGPSQAFEWPLPAWVPPPTVPVDNPMTRDKAELGRHLFYDTRLSANLTMSCATCHVQAKAFTDGRSTPVGVTGEKGVRSAKSLTDPRFLQDRAFGDPWRR